MSTYRTFKSTAAMLDHCSRTGAHKVAIMLAQSQRAEADRLAEVQTLVTLVGGTAELSVHGQLDHLARAHRLLGQYAEAVGLGIKARLDCRRDSVRLWRDAANRARALASEACSQADYERWIEDHPLDARCSCTTPDLHPDSSGNHQICLYCGLEAAL